jgi:hypothetical protein
MKRVIVLTILAVLSNVLQVRSQSVNGTVEGIVVRAGTSEPIGAAQITLQYQEPDLPGGAVPPDISATSNPEGRFRIENVPPGIYLAEARREGYFGLFFGHITDADVIEITVTRRPQSLSFSMFPGGAISGKILGPNGQPAAGVSVSLLRLIYGDGGKVLLVTEQEVAANALGDYHISGISPGSYYLRATRRVSPFAASPENSQIFAYFPGTTDAARAESVSVASGQESFPPDFKLQTIPTVRLSGQIVYVGLLAPPEDSTAKAMNLDLRTSFFLVPRDPSVARDFSPIPLENVAKDPSSGQFEIRGVVKGSYNLFARIQIDSIHAVDTGGTPIDVIESDFNGVTLWAYPPTDLNGRVVIDRDASSLLPKVSEHYMNLWPVDGPGGGYGAQVDSYGNFTFAGVRDGQYRLTPPTSRAVTACLSDMRQGGRSIMDDGIITVNGGKADPIQLNIAAVCGRVKGTVVNPDGMPTSASVVLVPDVARRRNPALYKRTESNAAGAFTVQGVAPGTYKLFAWRVSPDGAEQTPEFLSRFESGGLAVTVGLGSSVEVPLQAIQ